MMRNFIKKTIYFCFVAYLLSASLQAQEPFNTSLYSRIYTYGQEIEKIGSSYYVMAPDKIHPFAPTGLRIYKLNINGKRLDSIRYVSYYDAFLINYMDGFQKMQARNDTLFVYLNHRTQDSTFIELRAFSPNLELYFTKVIMSVKTDYYMVNPDGFITCPDGGFLFSVRRNRENHIIKANGLGQEQQNIQIGRITISSIFKQANEDSYLFSGLHKDYGNNNLIVGKIKLNPLSMQFIRIPDRNSLANCDYVHITPDGQGGCMAATSCSYSEWSCGQTWADARLLHLDSSLNITRDTLYTHPFVPTTQCLSNDRAARFSGIKQLPNGNYVALVYYRPGKAMNDLHGQMLWEISPDFEVVKKRELFSPSGTHSGDTKIKDWLIDEFGIVMTGRDWHDRYMTDTMTGMSPWVVRADWNFCDGNASCDTNIHIAYLNNSDTIIRREDNYQLPLKLTGGQNNSIKYNFRGRIKSTSHDSRFFWISDISLDSVLYLDIPVEYQKKDSIWIIGCYLGADGFDYPRKWADPLHLYFSTDEEGIDEHETSYFRMYPNPTEKILNIELDIKYNKQYMYIYNIAGILLREEELNHEAKQNIDISELKPGIYFVKIGSEVQKLIVR